MRSVALLTLMIAGAVQADVTFDVELWPGEGRPVIESVAPALELREQPSRAARQTQTLSATPGQRLTFDETRFRTIRPGRLQAVVPATVSGRRLGSVQALSRADYYSARYPDTAVKLNAGDSFDYLQYRAEGTCFVRIGGVVIDAQACPWDDRQAFRRISEPVVEWWVRLVPNGKPAGWLLLTDKTARVVERQF